MKRVVLGFASFLLVFSFFTSFASAEETSMERSSEGNVGMSSEEKSKKLQERMNEYKRKKNVRLSVQENNKIVGTCKSAQVITSRIHTSISNVRNNRVETYTKITGRLNSVVEKLKLANINTAELEVSLTTVKASADQFIVGVEEYQSMLNDLSEMDCVNDAAAFRSALELAKEKRQELFEKSKEIRTYVSGTIKPILQNLRQQLKPSNNGQ